MRVKQLGFCLGVESVKWDPWPGTVAREKVGGGLEVGSGRLGSKSHIRSLRPWWE